MPRKSRDDKTRKILPDPLLRSVFVAKFINCLMKDGKKSVAQKILYSAFDIVIPKLVASGKITAFLGDKSEGDESQAAPAKLGSIWEDETARSAASRILRAVLERISPMVEVKSRRVGGTVYQVPVEINAKRRQALGMRTLCACALARNEKSMIARLSAEMLDALEGRGAAMKKKEDMHRMADANKAYAHYREKGE